jgi:hypothetical protein
MPLTCEEVRELLWPPDGPRRHVAEEAAARAHLSGCPSCRAFFVHDAELTSRLRRLGESIEVHVPDRLETGVALALNQPSVEIGPMERRRWGSSRRAQIAAAAAAVLLLAAGQFVASRYGDEPDTSRFAADFMRTAAVDLAQPGLDIRQVGSFYQRELGREIVPVALHQAPVTRATVCDLRGDLGSMVEYDLEGTRLVHYRIPLDTLSSDAPRAGVPIAVDSREGVQVAHWTDGEFEHALVSSAPAEYLEWLAENRFSRPPSVTNYGSPASRSWRRTASED